MNTVSTPPHRCREHVDYIGGFPCPYECLICGKRLYPDEVHDDESDLEDVEGPRYLGCPSCGEAYDVEGDDIPDECSACAHADVVVDNSRPADL